MKVESEQDNSKFKVVCAWCGALIRRGSAKDSRGMCLKCYSRMLSEHAGPVEPERRRRWAHQR